MKILTFKIFSTIIIIHIYFNLQAQENKTCKTKPKFEQLLNEKEKSNTTYCKWTL
jgi:hypothetical protein